MADTPETPPAIPQPPPSTALPKLDSITQEDLSREISGGDIPPPKEKANFTQENTRVGDDKGHVVDKDLDGFGKAARDMMKKKQEEGKPVTAGDVHVIEHKTGAFGKIF